MSECPTSALLSELEKKKKVKVTILAPPLAQDAKEVEKYALPSDFRDIIDIGPLPLPVGPDSGRHGARPAAQSLQFWYASRTRDPALRNRPPVHLAILLAVDGWQLPTALPAGLQLLPTAPGAPPVRAVLDEFLVDWNEDYVVTLGGVPLALLLAGSQEAFVLAPGFQKHYPFRDEPALPDVH